MKKTTLSFAVCLCAFFTLLFIGCDERVDIPCTLKYGPVFENDEQYREYFMGSCKCIGSLPFDGTDEIDLQEVEEKYLSELKDEYGIDEPHQNLCYFTKDRVLELVFQKFIIKDRSLGMLDFNGASDYHFHEWKGNLLIEWGSPIMLKPMSVGKMTDNYFLLCAVASYDKGIYRVYKKIESVAPLIEKHQMILKTLGTKTWRLTEKRECEYVQDVLEAESTETYENVYLDFKINMADEYLTPIFDISIFERTKESEEKKAIWTFTSNITYSDIYNPDAYVKYIEIGTNEVKYCRIIQLDEACAKACYEEQIDGVKRVVEYTFGSKE